MSVTQGRPTGHGQTGTSPRAQWGEAGGACPSRRTPRGARGGGPGRAPEQAEAGGLGAGDEGLGAARVAMRAAGGHGGQGASGKAPVGCAGRWLRGGAPWRRSGEGGEASERRAAAEAPRGCGKERGGSEAHGGGRRARPRRGSRGRGRWGFERRGGWGFVPIPIWIGEGTRGRGEGERGVGVG